MPYIVKEKRHKIDPHIKVLCECLEDDLENVEGNLNYIISSIINNVISQKGKNYKNINSLIGALECTKIELYRKIAAKYEDEKIKENGDVYNV